MLAMPAAVSAAPVALRMRPSGSNTFSITTPTPTWTISRAKTNSIFRLNHATKVSRRKISATPVPMATKAAGEAQLT